MYTRDEFNHHRFDQPEVVPDKRKESDKLQQEIAEFEARGGRITEISEGARTYKSDMRIPTEDNMESGYPGITWSAKFSKWNVRTTNSRRHIGFALTIIEALELQEKDRRHRPEVNSE